MEIWKKMWVGVFSEHSVFQFDANKIKNTRHSLWVYIVRTGSSSYVDWQLFVEIKRDIYVPVHFVWTFGHGPQAWTFSFTMMLPSDSGRMKEQLTYRKWCALISTTLTVVLIDSQCRGWSKNGLLFEKIRFSTLSVMKKFWGVSFTFFLRDSRSSFSRILGKK